MLASADVGGFVPAREREEQPDVDESDPSSRSQASSVDVVGGDTSVTEERRVTMTPTFTSFVDSMKYRNSKKEYGECKVV